MNAPVIVATGNCGGVTNTGGNCFAFLDKDFLTIDQARRKMYVSFTDFTRACPAVGNCTFHDDIELASCDLDNPMAPVCSNGTTNGAPYLTVQPADAVNGCEYEGAYPAVHKATGDVYVAFEYNWATNLFGGPCTFSVPVQDIVAYVPASCLPDPDTAPLTPTCPGPFTENSNDIVSMDAAFIPGYNRFPMNDFPRIAVSDPSGTVSIVWNDARRVPTGDILLQSFALGSLVPVQDQPVRLNTDGNFKWKLLPALRNADSEGKLNVSGYVPSTNLTLPSQRLCSTTMAAGAVAAKCSSASPAPSAPSSTLISTKTPSGFAARSLLPPAPPKASAL